MPKSRVNTERSYARSAGSRRAKGGLSRSGFTLVELLVVIAIIAVLSLIAISTYSGAQIQARNTKRIGDIDAISKALEVNKDSTGYKPLADNQMADGIPTSGPKGDQYCINYSALGITKPGSVWTDCSPDIGDPDWSQVAVGKPQAGSVIFMVCASLEGSPTNPVFCRVSTQ